MTEARSASLSNSFFAADLHSADPELAKTIDLELGRLRDHIELIASENIVSRAVLEAQGSMLTNKYAEGYPGRRYYGGCEFVDMAEKLAIERVTRLFGCRFANVQPNSGSQANQGVFLALMKPGETFMGLNLNAGGHLTHGSPVNMSGKWFNVVPYNVRPDDQRIDMDEVEKLAHEHKPKIIIAGGSGYARHWDFARFREIADALAPISSSTWRISPASSRAARILRPSRMPMSSTSTTHKTLRGPRGGLILTNDEDHRQENQLGRLPRPPGRAADARHRGQGRRLRRGAAPEFKLYAKARRRKRQGACRRLSRRTASTSSPAAPTII